MIKGDVLSCLNVREAVRTRTLSSTWMDAWTDMAKISLRDRNYVRTRFVTLVDMVLALHKGVGAASSRSAAFSSSSCLTQFSPFFVSLKNIQEGETHTHTCTKEESKKLCPEAHPLGEYAGYIVSASALLASFSH